MNSLLRLAAAGALAAAPAFAFAAGPWTGPYAGGQIGINSASADGLSTEQGATAGVFAGYNFQLNEHFVLGANLFWNWNQSKSHTIGGTSLHADAGIDVYGVDVTAGFPLGPNATWMPYAKVGYGWGDPTGDLTGGTQNAVRYGAGVAWRMTDRYSLLFQYIHQNFGGGFGNYTNDNFTVGVSFHF